MKLARILLSSTSVACLSVGMVTPAFAYFRGTPPMPTTQIRQSQATRPAYADAYASILSISRLYRKDPEANLTGRAWLARSMIQRPGQRNYRRHILGQARGYDYRVLNAQGDTRRIGFDVANQSLPLSLVQTGRDYRGRGDFPTSRAIRSGAYNDRLQDGGENGEVLGVSERDRNLLQEMGQE